MATKTQDNLRPSFLSRVSSSVSAEGGPAAESLLSTSGLPNTKRGLCVFLEFTFSHTSQQVRESSEQGLGWASLGSQRRLAE